MVAPTAAVVLGLCAAGVARPAEMGRRRAVAAGAACACGLPAASRAADDALVDGLWTREMLGNSNERAVADALRASGGAAATCGQGASDLLEEAEVNVFTNRCMRLPARVLPRAGRVLVLQQSAVSAGSTGAAVWNGALALSAYMDGLGREAFAGTRVLELGAGCALCSVVAHSLGAARVVATDGNDALLANAAANLATNRLAQGGGSVGTAELGWGAESARAFCAKEGERWDWVVGSDLTYNANAWGSLGSALRALGGAPAEPSAGAQRPTRVLLAMTDRYPGEFNSVKVFFEGAGFRWAEKAVQEVGDAPVHIIELSRR